MFIFFPQLGQIIKSVTSITPIQYIQGSFKIHPDLPYVTPHKLRHTYASYMLQSGADVETVRMLLGHSDISTTQIYVHSNYKQMKEAADKLNFS